MSNGIDLTESSKVNLDVKTLVGIVVLVLAMGGGYVKLQGQIAALQLDVVRMQDQQGMNTEFRIKWPRGELGALPDDAKQDLKIEYLQKEVENLKKLPEFDLHKIAQNYGLNDDETDSDETQSSEDTQNTDEVCIPKPDP